ncbi:MAG: hypothetical protein IJA77_12590 [Clostridia bacterium]|nr:hypothetical protein [Clostridia bacterium]
MSRRFKLLGLIALLLAALCLAGAALAEAAQIPAEYKQVAENSRFNLYLREDTLAVIVESKENGSLLWSTLRDPEKHKASGNWPSFYQSGVVLEYIEDLKSTNGQANPVKNATLITYDYVENGFTAHINYTDIGISHDLVLSMDEAGLHVTVPQDSFRETKDQPYMIVKIDGKDTRVDLKKYEKTSEVTEYVLILADGTEYVIPTETTVTLKGKTALNVPVSDGTTQVVPMDVKTITVKDEAGKDVVLPSYRVVAKTIKGENGAADTYELVTDGATYPLSADLFVSKKDDATIIVLASDGKSRLNVALDKPLAPVPTITVKDSAGQPFQLPMDQPASYRTNLYRSGTKLSGEAFRYPKDDVVLLSETSYTAAGLYIFPFLGYSYMGEDEGYMIIPDGQGAIIKLENNEGRYKNPFSRQVYGVNIGVDGEVHSASTVPVENVIMPVFGMVHTADQIGFLGVIEEGDYAANIMAYMNGNTVSNFDWICAKYTYRLVYNQPMGMNGSAAAGTVPTRTAKARSMDITQHFLLEDGDNASYAGLAVAYRNYLIDQGTFAGASDRPFDVQLDFLGMERENYIFGKQDVVMTSFETAGNILRELKANGVDEMAVVLRGWQDQGLTGGVPVEGFNPARSLGGKSGLNALREYAEAEGIDLALEADVLSLNVETHPTLTYSAYKQITSKTYERPTFGKVYSTLQYLTPSVSADKAANVVRELNANAVKGVSFTGITQLLADYHFKDAYHDTTEMAEIYAGIAKNAGENLTVTLSSPNAYLWPYADVLSDLPIGGSDHAYTDAEIPFLAIALSGQVPYYAEYVNFQANTHEFFLHLMEQGARPAFLLTWEDPIELQDTNSSDIYSSRYELYQEMIQTWYKDLNSLHEAVGEDGAIVNHERSGNMVRVTWDNGTQVYLNFGDKEASFDDVTLGKLQWKVVNASGN